ncbi:MAG: hypothetical protein ABIN97_09225 [Ginsengibacter sp.]
MYRLIIILPLVLFTFFSGAQKQINRTYFINLLNQKKYQRVFEEANRLRDSVYGKCAILDYFIGKSLCLDGYKNKSVEWLQYILANYPLKPNARQFIKGEISSCNSNSTQPVATPASALMNVYTVPMPQAGVGGISKMGMTYDCTEREKLVNFGELVTEEELESRLFSPLQKKQAYQKLKTILNVDYSIDTNLSRYIIVSPKNMHIEESNVETVTNNLEKAYHFFVTYYGLRAPDKLITVYLAPDRNTLKTTAKLIHGIDIPNETLGYSLLADLSLSGMAFPDQVGTLYHELFHLIVRTDAGDIPAWLDEGMASLYSIYSWKNEVLKGTGNTWRLKQLTSTYLRSTRQKVPSIENLLSYDWQQFNGGDGNNLCKASVNYALANHFLIYLQEKDLLKALMKTYRFRKPPGDKDQANESTENISLIENLLKDSIGGIQKKFNAWFFDKYHFNLYGFMVASGDIKQPYSTVQKVEMLLAKMKESLRRNNIPDTTDIEQRFKKAREEYNNSKILYDSARSIQRNEISQNANNAVQSNNQQVTMELKQDENTNKYFKQLNGAEDKLKKLGNEIQQILNTLPEPKMAN